MEELKILVDMVAHLPAMALWVIGFFFAYKVIVIGSIYGVIKFVVQKIHDMYNKEVKFKIGQTIVINAVVEEELIGQIKRLSKNNGYVHSSDVNWLRDQIDKRDKL